ncbi:MAG: hypothetical protein E6767_13805 [Dysgonomonas sp.]|nr:hypothetical protein [Dysgonomonas sp.]
MKVLYISLIVFFIFTLKGMAQATLPVVKLPEPPKPTMPLPNTQIGIGRTYNMHNPHNPHAVTDIQQRNAALLQEFQENEMFLAEARRQSEIKTLLTGRFPYQSAEQGTFHYHSAFNEINSMLEGDTTLNLGRAIFLVENAYYENQYEYNDFKNYIEQCADFCNERIAHEKLDINDNLTKNMMIFRFISDTLEWRDKTTKRKMYHYPVKYDYDDYKSEINYDSHFVTSLMRTGKGQCQSMPLFYLTIAEEMGANAYWALSPKHSLVKIQDEEDKNWYNLELTCKAILSDAHYMNNSYIKAEAIQNRLYLEPLDKRQTVTKMLLELARGYLEKYGFDDFYMQCVTAAMKNMPDDIDALWMQSAYQTRITLALAQALNAPNPEIMKEMSPEAYQHFELMQAQYRRIDELGYEDLPEDLYARWLAHIAKEKEKSEKAPSIFIKLKKD